MLASFCARNPTKRPDKENDKAINSCDGGEIITLTIGCIALIKITLNFTGDYMKKLCVLLAIGVISVSGCASIVSKSNWPVTVQSTPSGAKCDVVKESGVKIHSGETPMTITLDASSGYFSSAKYMINCSKDGKQASSELSSHLNGWYVGNIVFGGLIGLLIVDPATGAMWRMDETAIVNIEPAIIPASIVQEETQLPKGNVNPVNGAIIQSDIKI